MVAEMCHRSLGRGGYLDEEEGHGERQRISGESKSETRTVGEGRVWASGTAAEGTQPLPWERRRASRKRVGVRFINPLTARLSGNNR